MLVRVRQGPLAGGDFDARLETPGLDDGPSEPRGREIWSADVENITVSALLAAGITIAPGDWIEFEEFTEQVVSAEVDPNQVVMSTVTTDQPGVFRSWQSVIEVEEPNAALMVCRAVIEHVGSLDGLDPADVWIRVE